jgi:hypothetical protein
LGGSEFLGRQQAPVAGHHIAGAIAEDGNIEPKIGVRGRFSENSQQISLIAGNLAGADPFGETAFTMISQ